ncbi:hypothetical protein [Actinomadura bangladeshensis]|uniref:Uncharacterized protein n=1 Tax=Actinomadura bangladeshensis TaxID=453573 RepID=A0A4V2XML5_9ACTN|nr:hypothetical protein [Actinomadura bangladeshensis]TDC14766.1 hypothetical protein E1284_17200 [Actinomadura bangladeshensis]
MDVFLVVLLVAVSLGGIALMYRRAGGSVKRAFARTPPSTVADAVPSSTCRLSGRATAVGAVPVSEASGRPYLARDLAIIPSSDGSDGTHPFGQAADFLLEDGTGVALIRAAGGRVAVEHDFTAPVTTLDKAPWADRLLRADGYHNGSPSTCRIRVYEGVIEPGARVGVLGRAEPPDAQARELGATLIIRGAGTAPVMIRPEPENS